MKPTALCAHCRRPIHELAGREDIFVHAFNDLRACQGITLAETFDQFKARLSDTTVKSDGALAEIWDVRLPDFLLSSADHSIQHLKETRVERHVIKPWVKDAIQMLSQLAVSFTMFFIMCNILMLLYPNKFIVQAPDLIGTLFFLSVLAGYYFLDGISSRWSSHGKKKRAVFQLFDSELPPKFRDIRVAKRGASFILSESDLNELGIRVVELSHKPRSGPSVVWGDEKPDFILRNHSLMQYIEESRLEEKSETTL